MPFVDYLCLARLQQLDTEIDAAYGAGNVELGIKKNFAFHSCLYENRPSTVLLPSIESVSLRLAHSCASQPKISTKATAWIIMPKPWRPSANRMPPLSRPQTQPTSKRFRDTLGASGFSMRN
nr:FCD domain-containing protein [Rhizobium mesoamericanum]